MRKRIPTSALFLILLMLATTLSTEASDCLDAFPVENFIDKNVNVTTSEGNVSVHYHLYKHIKYMAHPVDTKYQSMNVRVPIQINGSDINATNAPILFAFSAPGGTIDLISDVGRAHSIT